MSLHVCSKLLDIEISIVQTYTTFYKMATTDYTVSEVTLPDATKSKITLDALIEHLRDEVELINNCLYLENLPDTIKSKFADFAALQTNMHTPPWFLTLFVSSVCMFVDFKYDQSTDTHKLVVSGEALNAFYVSTCEANLLVSLRSLKGAIDAATKKHDKILDGISGFVDPLCIDLEILKHIVGLRLNDLVNGYVNNPDPGEYTGYLRTLAQQ